MSTHVTKEDWIAMLRELGMDDATMNKWHHIFETRHPEGHQSFLSWLGIPADEIEKLRLKHR